MTEEEKLEYKKLLEKQYQNLSYKIKKEIIAKDTATVDVEIEVLDYKNAINKSEKECEKNLPNDGKPIYCSCWRIKDNKYIKIDIDKF